jgi:chemotaxis protein CheD
MDNNIRAVPIGEIVTSDAAGARVPAASSAKFVDQGTPLLVESLLKLGGRRTRLTAQLCGGAQVLSAPGFEEQSILNIGERNIRAAENALKVAGIRVKAQDTGGRTGRTVRLYIANGRVTAKSLGRGERVLYERGSSEIEETKPGDKGKYTSRPQRSDRNTHLVLRTGGSRG